MMDSRPRFTVNGKTVVIYKKYHSAGRAQKAALADKRLKWMLVPGHGWATVMPTDPHTGIAIDKEPLK